MVSEIDDVREAHEVESVLRLPAADARHQEVLLAQSPEDLLELGRYLGHVRRRYDRGQGAVYIREDRGRARILPPGPEPLPGFGALFHVLQDTCRPRRGLAASSCTEGFREEDATIVASRPVPSAAGQHALALQELLQAQAALYEAFRVLYAHVAVVPGFPPVAGLRLLADRVGQDETVLWGVVRQPPGSASDPEGLPELVAHPRVREVHCGTELVLAASGRGAYPARARAVDAPQPAVGPLLLKVRPVSRGHHQLLAGCRGCGYEAAQVLGGLAPEEHILTERGNAVGP